jgi:hypothetical protein
MGELVHLPVNNYDDIDRLQLPVLVKLTAISSLHHPFQDS